jgi:hypothetical protein
MNTNTRNLILFAVALLFFSALALPETIWAQKRDRNKATVLKQERAAAAGPNVRNQQYILFDAAFEEDILRVPFVESTTDEVEYVQIYKPFSENVDIFGKNLSKIIKDSNSDYASFVIKYSRKFKAENDFAVKKMRANRDKGRVESLKSIFDILKQEHKKTIEDERDKIKSRFESLFSAFTSAYASQKNFMLKNTVYESETSELALALGSFETEIKEKNSKIKEFIDMKFSKFESETLAGEKNGDL